MEDSYGDNCEEDNNLNHLDNLRLLQGVKNKVLSFK